MSIRETLKIRLYGVFVQVGRSLIHLDYGIVGLHIVGCDREWYHELRAIALAEISHALHLLGIERTENDVAFLCLRVEQCLAYVGIYGHIPCVHIH